MTQLKDSASYWSQELPGGRGYWYSNVTHTKTNGVRQLKKKKKKKKKKKLAHTPKWVTPQRARFYLTLSGKTTKRHMKIRRAVRK